MPFYTFRDETTQQIIEKSMRISELDEFKLQNPNLTKLIVGAPSIGDPVRLGRKKPDAGFRDVLKNVQHHHKKDNINTW